MSEIETIYEENKRLLTHIAYHMLGDINDARDAVHDVFTRNLDLDTFDRVDNIQAFLCKSVTNRCLDVLKSGTRKREVCVGTWLPEPLSVNDDPLDVLIRKHTLSYSFMFLLERLSPVERVVYILRSAFEYHYEQIAEILHKSNPAVRKIFSRSRQKVQEGSMREEETEVENELSEAFIKALETGETSIFLKLLTEDVTYYAEGGGELPIARKPLPYKAFVQLFTYLSQQVQHSSYKDLQMVSVRINTGYGVLLKRNEEPLAIVTFKSENGKIVDIYNQTNPMKLKMTGAAL